MNTRTRYWSLSALVAGLLVLALPPVTQGAGTMDSILVVPNPYNVSDRTFGPRSNLQGYERLRFANLPTPNPSSPTTITIYTSALNLVMTLHHAAGRDLFWDGRNADNQYVVSGLYIYVVHHPDYGRKVGKLVVIR